MRNFIVKILIKILGSEFVVEKLFELVGNEKNNLYSVKSLFGSAWDNHEVRKKKWEHALARLFADKDLLDFLHYQSETDKEKVFQGKINQDFSRGARLRTLYIVYSAHRAFLNLRRKRRSNAQEIEEDNEDLKELNKSYTELSTVK